MMKQIIKLWIGVLLFMGSHLSLLADDFNPTSPPEPYQYSKLTMNARPAEAVSSLYGSGYYKEGMVVTLQSYRRSNVYVFSHWEKNGEWYSSETSPRYTMEDDAVTFTAVYEYNPGSPDEPYLKDNRIYLVAEPLTACSFNIQSGLSYKEGQTVSLRATATSGYTFLGWYDNGKLKSTNLSFSFYVEEGDHTMVARFEYNPANPFEPSLPDGVEQDNVQTTPTGDADGDGVVDVADAVRVINLCLTGEYDAKADANGDGEVDVTDAVTVINICLKN